MNPKLRRVFFFLFALSGFSGLIYESIWTHYLKLFLGHAAYAQTLVLAIFMGGLALGSWICSKYSAGWKRLFLGYAAAETVIGIFALVFHNVFDQAVRLSYSAVLPGIGFPAGVLAFKWTLSAFLILPQTVLLGMTFPLMSAGILRAFPGGPGRSISMLYFTNSVGAAIGVLASGFVLVKAVGLPGTIQIAGLLNVAVGISVWLLAREHAAGPEEIVPEKDRMQEPPDRRWYWFLLAASMVTGTASFIYEIGWIRMLNLVLGSSTHAFELMLSAFIFGLAFGGLWIQRRIDRIINPVRFLIAVQVAMGLLALSTLLLYGNTFEVMQWILRTVSKTDNGYLVFNLSMSAIALSIMLPTTFCAGMTLPLITYTLIAKGHGERSIGAVYAANTIGAIAGVFFAVHAGMPLLGLKGLITLGGGLDILLGLVLLWSAEAKYRKSSLPLLVSALCICAVAACLLFVKLDYYKMASGVYRYGSLKSPQYNKLLYHKDGKTSTVSVFSGLDNAVSIRTNGKVDAAIGMDPGGESTEDEPTMVLLAAIPMALHPQARTVANIGLGSGLTSNTLFQNSSIELVDTVEIEPAMVEGAMFFRPRVGLVFTDPRSRIHIDDAKTFFSTNGRKYDIIISEPSNPWVSGVAGLFSEEFYRLVSRYLAQDGLFCQWIQLYEIDLDLVVSVLKAVSLNFSDFVVYSANDTDLLIVAGNGSPDTAPAQNILNIPGIARELKKVHIENIQDIGLRKVGNKKILGRFLDSFPIRANSDYYPVLDQNAARTQFLKTTAGELPGFTHEPLPASEMLMGTGLPWEETNITISPHFAKSKAAATAMALRDYYLRGSFSLQGSIPEDIKKQAVELKKLFSEQCLPGEGQTDRLFALYNIANKMVPFLRPAELDAFWKTLESGACARVLTDTEREWIELFKAAGRRDAKAMADTAETILEKAHDLPPGPVRYLVASGMLGNLANGDKGKSLSLWNRFRSQIYGMEEPSLLFRLLAAESAG